MTFTSSETNSYEDGLRAYKSLVLARQKFTDDLSRPVGVRIASNENGNQIEI